MAHLKTLEIPLEAVTPLWIGGAGFRAELRPPSVRGCMRFWFRALIGGLLGEALKDVWEVESAVYGNTQRASCVGVRMAGTPQTGPSVVGEAEQWPGLNYMLWTVYQQKRDAILAGERFQLRLHTRALRLPATEVVGRKVDMADALELAAASVWLLLRLGAVGGRSRRGVGTLRAVAEPDGWPASLPPLVSKAATPAELAVELHEGIKQIRRAAGWTARPLGDVTEFDILHPRCCRLGLLDKTFPSWWEALNWVGERYHAFRIEHKLDASGVAAFLEQGRMTLRTVQRAIFGLPIVFFFKSMMADLTGRGMDPREARRKASATVVPNRGQARNSPLFFHVVPLAGPQPAYGILMGLFRSRLLPDDEMTIRPNDSSMRPVRVAVPTDYAVIEQWFERAKGEGGLHPVGVE